MLYQPPSTTTGKQRIKEFNYAGLNATPFVALENNAPNAYTNPILQVILVIYVTSDVDLIYTKIL